MKAKGLITTLFAGATLLTACHTTKKVQQPQSHEEKHALQQAITVAAAPIQPLSAAEKSHLLREVGTFFFKDDPVAIAAQKNFSALGYTTRYGVSYEDVYPDVTVPKAEATQLAGKNLYILIDNKTHEEVFGKMAVYVCRTGNNDVSVRYEGLVLDKGPDLQGKPPAGDEVKVVHRFEDTEKNLSSQTKKRLLQLFAAHTSKKDGTDFGPFTAIGSVAQTAPVKSTSGADIETLMTRDGF